MQDTSSASKQETSNILENINWQKCLLDWLKKSTMQIMERRKEKKVKREK